MGVPIIQIVIFEAKTNEKPNAFLQYLFVWRFGVMCVPLGQVVVFEGEAFRNFYRAHKKKPFGRRQIPPQTSRATAREIFINYLTRKIKTIVVSIGVPTFR